VESTTHGFTVEGFIYIPTGAGTAWDGVISGTGSDAWYITIWSDGKLAFVGKQGSDGAEHRAFSAAPISQGAWHHVAAVGSWNANGASPYLVVWLYVDYIQGGTPAIFHGGYEGGQCLKTTAGDYTVGFYNGNPFMLDEVRISDTVLDPNEFLHPVPPICLPSMCKGFNAGFIGTDACDINSLPEWNSGYNNGCDTTLDGNEGKFTFTAAGWRSATIIANDTFDPMGINPISETGGLRFEYTVTAMSDSAGVYNTYNGGSTLYLANALPGTTYGWSVLGEKLALDMAWHKGTNNVGISFNIANKFAGDPTTDVGVGVYTDTISNVDMDGGDKIKIAMEIRDDAESNDVRVGYQVYDYSADTWLDWEYSQWFDPTDDDGSLGLDDDANNNSEFGSSWKTNWTDSTYFYIQPWQANGRTTTVWVDDAIVTKR
jgi:hypothetical protein